MGAIIQLKNENQKVLLSCSVALYKEYNNKYLWLDVRFIISRDTPNRGVASKVLCVYNSRISISFISKSQA